MLHLTQLLGKDGLRKRKLPRAAPLLECIDHLLLELLQRGGIAQIETFGGSVMGEILEFVDTLFGEEFQCRLMGGFVVAVAKGLESRIFREFPVGVGQAYKYV